MPGGYIEIIVRKKNYDEFNIKMSVDCEVEARALNYYIDDGTMPENIPENSSSLKIIEKFNRLFGDREQYETGGVFLETLRYFEDENDDILEEKIEDWVNG